MPDDFFHNWSIRQLAHKDTVYIVTRLLRMRQSESLRQVATRGTVCSGAKMATYYPSKAP